MPIMNKPAQNDTNWYQPVTDNWTAIQNDIVDKSIFQAKGDLIAASGASTAVRQPVGQDGQILVAASGQSTGLNWAAGTFDPTSYQESLVLNTRFFSSAGLLPGTKYYETAADSPPVPDWDNTGVTPTAVGSYKRWEGVTGPQLFGWDLGAARQRILMIFSAMGTTYKTRDPFVASTKPATGDLNGNGYTGGTSGPGTPQLWKVTSGSLATLSPTTYLNGPDYYEPFGVAFRFDNGNIRIFYRFGNFEWIEGVFINDGTYTTLRYCGMRLFDNGAVFLGAMGIWYDT